jgi:hypothetical protein
MTKTLFLIFNHQFTSEQDHDARRALGVIRIVNLPAELQDLWGNVPSGMPEIKGYLGPIRGWLTSQAQEGDYVLIQGDFGACYLMVKFAFEERWVPIYSTTEREAVEEIGPNGSVKLTHHFRHRIFRRYGR